MDETVSGFNISFVATSFWFYVKFSKQRSQKWLLQTGDFSGRLALEFLNPLVTHEGSPFLLLQPQTEHISAVSLKIVKPGLQHISTYTWLFL